jgi:Ca2+-binding RTX toxin-like protein
VVTGASGAALLGFAADPALAAYMAQVQSGTLQIIGNGAGDKLSLQPSPTDPNQLLVDVGENGTIDFSFERDTFTAVDVEAGGGEDTVDVGNGLASFGTLTIDGGAGNDTLHGGDGNDVLIGGSGNDFIDGNRGNDVAELGSGNDTFNWDPGDGSDTVEGQGGKDVLDFNGSNVGEHMTLSANGSRVRFFRDVGAVTMDLDGIEAMTLDALGGADTITVDDLSGTDLRDASIDLSGVAGTTIGDGQPDTVIANGTGGTDHVDVTRLGSQVQVKGLAAQLSIAGGEANSDSLHVNTLGGKDKVTVAPEVSQLIAPFVDLGADQ